MLKRTKGRLLIALLVITGLAGTINDDSISQKDRKYAWSELKNSKNEFLKSVHDLSDTQLDFKTAPDQFSIRDYIYHIAVSEKNLWDLFETAMKSPSNSDKRSEKMTDEQIVKMIEDGSINVETTEPLKLANYPYHSLDEANSDFKDRRNYHIKYMKSTTEDLRSHIIQIPFGWIDCFQLCLLIASHSYCHSQQIEKLKTDINFPSYQ